MNKGKKMNVSLLLIPAILLCAGLGVSVDAETLTLEQVIREVSTKSDSISLMKETIIKSKQMVREQYAAAWPKISATIYGGHTFPTGAGVKTPTREDPSNGKYADPTHTDYQQDSAQIAASLAPLYGSLGGIKDGLSASKPSDMEVYSSSINIAQPIYTFGKIGTAVRIASQFDSAVNLAYTRNIQNLQLSALDLFYAVLMADKQVDVGERSLARKTEASALLDRNFAMGSGVKAQVLLARSDVKAQSAALITARQNAVAIRRTLKMTLGRPLDNSDISVDSNSTLPILATAPTIGADKALADAVSNRQDLRMIDYYRKANEGGASLFRAMYLPTLAATGSAGFNSTDIKNAFDWDYRTWSVGVALQWSFFDGFANSAKAAQYTSDAHKLETTGRVMRKILAIDVSNSIQECAAADTNLIAIEDLFHSAEEAYNMTHDNFMQGSGQLIELERAEEQLRQSELALFGAKYRLARSRAVLQVAMGNDIVKLEDK